MRILSKINEVGIINTIKGTLRREQYKKLQKEFGFDLWHISPYELRGYAQGVAKYINSKNADGLTVVDIGCGMGEVLRNIKADTRIGYDLDNKVIACAKNLVKDDDTISFKIGSFNEYSDTKDIDYLLTLGFMHGSREDSWVELYHNICNNNNIKHIIVDTIPEGYDGAHHLDFTKILPRGYILKETLGPYLNDRYIEVYEKRNP